MFKKIDKKIYFVFQPWNIPHSNRSAKDGLTLEQGVDQWESHKRQEGDRQKQNLIIQGISNKTFLGDIPLTFFNTSPQQFELVWQIPTPRIGIIALSPTNTNLKDLYNFMCQVYNAIQDQLRQYNQNMNITFDCHLCLHVRSQLGINVTCRQGEILSLNGQKTTNNNLVGYFQMAEDHYLWCLPQDLREIWFDAFTHADHFVGT